MLPLGSIPKTQQTSFQEATLLTLWSERKQNDLNFLLLHRKYVIIAVIIKKYRFFLTVSFEDSLPPSPSSNHETND